MTVCQEKTNCDVAITKLTVVDIEWKRNWMLVSWMWNPLKLSSSSFLIFIDINNFIKMDKCYKYLFVTYVLFIIYYSRIIYQNPIES